MKDNTESAEKIFSEEEIMGWDDHSKLSICLAFIDKQKLHPQFSRHIKQQAKKEQEFTS